MPGIASAVVGSISRAIRTPTVAESPTEVVLIPMKDSGEPDADAPVLRFQYFPESIQDNKAINYQQKEIPGGSLPIYQWVSSGERLISFNVMFSCDVDMTADVSLANLVGARTGLQSRNVDIRSAVAWLRQYVHPSYGNTSSNGGNTSSGNSSGNNSSGTTSFSFLSFPPKRLRLFIPNSGIGLAGGNPSENGQNIHPHSVLCVMTQCDVTWDAYFPSGLPRLATVSLAFAQVAQTGTHVAFPTASAMVDAIKGKDQVQTTPFFGYKLRANPRTGQNGNETVGGGG